MNFETVIANGSEIKRIRKHRGARVICCLSQKFRGAYARLFSVDSAQCWQKYSDPSWINYLELIRSFVSFYSSEYQTAQKVTVFRQISVKRFSSGLGLMVAP